MVTVCPATLKVPVRASPVFWLTEKFTVPFPVPDPPEEIVIQETLLAAVQAHPAAAVTLALPCPPAAAKEDGVTPLTE